MPFASPVPLKPTERVMVFIDGGYLRDTYRKLFGDDNIDYGELLKGLIVLYEKIPENPFRADIIRAYYYDAICSKKESEYDVQVRYFKSVTKYFRYSMRLGHLVQTVKGEKKRFRQKGVDTLMAIDALTKAYLNHYDTGIFLLADRDFIPLIEAVKNTGKKTVGFFHGNETSPNVIQTKVPQRLMRVFDWRVALPEKTLRLFRHTEKNPTTP